MGQFQKKITAFDTSSNIAVDSSDESDSDESVIKTEPNIDDQILEYHPSESVIKTEPGIDEEEIWNELNSKKRKVDPSTFCETVFEPQKSNKKKEPNSGGKKMVKLVCGISTSSKLKNKNQ